MATAFLADHLESQSDAIIDCWRRRVLGTVNPAGAPPAELLDSLPQFVQELARMLRDTDEKPPAFGRVEDAASALAVDHGAQRFHAGFSLGAVIREYGVFRGCLLDSIDNRQLAVSHQELQTVLNAIDVAIAHAAEQFERERDQMTERLSEQHFGFIAHELRNPIGSAMLAAQALQKRAGGAPDVIVHRLGRNLERLRDLVDSSLIRIRVRHLGRTQDLRYADVDLRALVDDVRGEVEGDAAEKGVAIALEGGASARADAVLLHSAITNLIRNAVKYSRPGGAIFVRIRSGSGVASVEVQDSCGGLPEGKTEELFTPFVQRGTDRSGFGLGLAITKDSVDAHRGTIQVENLPGQGCIFMISLPTS